MPGDVAILPPSTGLVPLVVQDPPPLHRLAPGGAAARSPPLDLGDVGQEHEARADRPGTHVADVDAVLFRVGVSDQRRNHLTARPRTSRLADLCEVRVQQLLELVCGASHLGCEQGELALHDHFNLIFDHLLSFPRGVLRRR